MLVSYHNPEDLDLNLRPEDGGSIYLWNVDILPQRRRPLLKSSPWRWRQQSPPKRWYPITTLHGATSLRNSNVKTDRLNVYWSRRLLDCDTM
jgi:hypothetical protein